MSDAPRDRVRPISKTEFRELELEQQIKLLTTSTHRLDENALLYAIEALATHQLQLAEILKIRGLVYEKNFVYGDFPERGESPVIQIPYTDDPVN